MKNIAIITARGGSKRIPKKNIKVKIPENCENGKIFTWSVVFLFIV